MRRIMNLIAWWIALGVLYEPCWAAAHIDSDDAFISPASLNDVLLRAVLDAEINATQEYVELLTAKAALLERMIQSEQARLSATTTATTDAANGTSQSWHRPASKLSNERFDDWLPARGTWYSPHEADNGPVADGRLHVELISFRANGNGGGKRSAHANRQTLHDAVMPVLQFLLAFNTENGFLQLFHPATRALLWQQRLEIPTRIQRIVFHSDRASHLILVTENDRLLVYKMRVFHGRRLVAGDYRRHSGKENPVCNTQVNLPAGELDAMRGKCPISSTPFHTAVTQRTIAPIGLYTHVEIEFDFAATSQQQLSRVTMVASHQTLVILTSSDRGHMQFIDGRNGLLLGALEDSRLRDANHFIALSSGVVAVAVTNRIHFIDIVDRRLLGLTCEGSRHAITSLDRDVWRPTVLYAGTSDGKALVFRLNRFGSIKRNNSLVPLGADAMNPYDDSDLGIPTCMLTALLQPRARVFDSPLRPTSTAVPALVTAMPGQVLLATADGHLVLYDTTSDPSVPTYLTEKSLASSLLQNAHTVAVYAGKDPLAGTAAVAVAILEHGRIRVELLASRLPPSSSGLDIGWIRAPMMVLCAFGVMFWQQNRFRRAPSSSLDLDLPSAAAGRSGSGSRQYGRSGVADWSRPTNHRAFSGR